jgi:hypothetical protein
MVVQWVDVLHQELITEFLVNGILGGIISWLKMETYYALPHFVSATFIIYIHVIVQSGLGGHQ